MNPLFDQAAPLEAPDEDEWPQRLVWVCDGSKMYLSCVPLWLLGPDGTCELDGKVMRWFVPTEF